jgi:tetratricopeptide (TPR) repeat protein
VADPEETPAGSTIGTLPFMSPEQAAGRIDELGPASDIYSLGATLYNLLTGRPPFIGTNPVAMLDEIHRGNWPAPRTISPAVPMALEAVCRKAMALAPEDRYHTALELAGDLEHWLADEPVSAWGEPKSVRLGRWFRRHRASVRVGMIAIAILVVFLAVATILLLAANAREQKAKAKSDDRFQMAFHVVDLFTKQISESPELKARDLELLRQTLLAEALNFYKKLAEDEAGDHAMLVRAERGRINLLKSDLLYQLGKGTEALAAATEARDAFMELAEAHPDQPRLQEELGQSYFTIGTLQADENDYSGAEQSWREAVRIQERLAGSHSDAAYQRDLARTYAVWGLSYFDRGNYADAEMVQQRALRILVALGQARQLDCQRELAECYKSLANLYRVTGKFKEAQAHIGEATKIADDLVRAEPQEPQNQSALADISYARGNIFFTIGRAQAAKESYENAREVLDKLSHAHPLVVDHAEALARALNSLGAAWGEMGQPSKAIEANQKALQLCEKLVEAQPGVHWNRFLRARVREHLAVVYRETGRLEDARTNHDAALEDCSAVVREHPDNATFAMNLGFMYASRGDLLRDCGETAKALGCYEQAITHLQTVIGAGPLHVDVREHLCLAQVGRAVALAHSGKHAEAVAVLSQTSKADQRRAVGEEILLATVLVHAHAGHYAYAVEKLNLLAQNNVQSGRILFDVACAYSLCAATVQRDASLSPAERKVRAEDSAAKAVKLLRSAQTADYFDTAAAVKRIEDEPGLDTLRSRQDFKELLREICGAKRRQ